MALPLFNPFDPQYVADPHSYFARLRETTPVHRAALPDGQTVWLLTRYADVEAALDDPRLVKDPRNARSPEELARMPARPEATRYIRTSMISRDPPDHTRLRRLVSKAFTPRMVEQLRPRDMIDVHESPAAMTIGRGQVTASAARWLRDTAWEPWVPFHNIARPRRAGAEPSAPAVALAVPHRQRTRLMRRLPESAR